MFNKKKFSLRKRLIILMIICWIAPLTIMLVMAFVSYRSGTVKRTENFLTSELRNLTENTIYKLDDAIAASRALSYDGNIEKAWRLYKKEEIDQAEFFRQSNMYLRRKFTLNDQIILSVMFLEEEPDFLFYNSEQVDPSLEYYRENIHDYAVEYGRQNTTAIDIKVQDDRLYVIRNLYTTTGYHKYGSLVLEMKPETFYQELHMDIPMTTILLFNGQDDTLVVNPLKERLMLDEMRNLLKEHYIGEKNKNVFKLMNNQYEGFLYERRTSDYQIGASIFANRSSIYQELNTFSTWSLAMSFAIVPLLFYLLYFLYENITAPINDMVDAAKKLEEGKLGTRVEEVSFPNEEFNYLLMAFNQMSYKLEYWFDYAYNEKLAAKDAKILALQAQINPHFLNNTLEMMNWQARMAGDDKVVKMIEALSTLLDYSMDREQKRLISLREELNCADAYFYIVSTRFGDRLTVEKEIDESLLHVKVPQLILQPILENAIKYGVERASKGRILVRVYKEQEHVVIQVLNSGSELLEEEKAKIKKILNGETKAAHDGNRSSLGIRNVHERIKLIYGDEYGLSITTMKEDTCAEIIFPMNIKSDQKEEFRLMGK